MKRLFSLLLSLGLLGYVAAGCGKDAEADTADDAAAADESAASDDASESSGAAGSMASLQRELNEVVLAIETVEDVEAADPKIGAIFDKMAETIKESATNPDMAAAQNDPEAQKLEAEMQKHIEEITTRDMEVGLALAGVMMKHADKLMKAATELLDSPEMKKQMEEAGDALKELEKLGN